MKLNLFDWEPYILTSRFEKILIYEVMDLNAQYILGKANKGEKRHDSSAILMADLMNNQKDRSFPPKMIQMMKSIAGKRPQMQSERVRGVHTCLCFLLNRRLDSIYSLNTELEYILLNVLIPRSKRMLFSIPQGVDEKGFYHFVLPEIFKLLPMSKIGNRLNLHNSLFTVRLDVILKKKFLFLGYCPDYSIYYLKNYGHLIKA